MLLHLRLSWPHRSFTTSLLSSLSLLILLSSSWCLVGLRPLLRLFLPGSLRHVIRSVVLFVLALATFLDFQPVSVVLPCLGAPGLNELGLVDSGQLLCKPLAFAALDTCH